MSDQAVESAADSATQERAEALGWIPPARFKGNPERFIDADKFIERGEAVLPIVKAQKVELEKKLAAQNGLLAETNAKLANAITRLEDIDLRHSVETQKAVERAKTDLKRQLAAASEAGDHAAVAEITSQMTELSTAEAEVKPKAEVKPAFKPADVHPDFPEWLAENAWFGPDKRRSALALAIAAELREDGETTEGKAFFNKVKRELAKTLKEDETPREDKVEGARNGSEGTERSSPRGKGYANLPAEAKKACDEDARRFVGPDKRYKDVAAWRAQYATVYFGD